MLSDSREFPSPIRVPLDEDVLGIEGVHELEELDDFPESDDTQETFAGQKPDPLKASVNRAPHEISEAKKAAIRNLMFLASQLGKKDNWDQAIHDKLRSYLGMSYMLLYGPQNPASFGADEVLLLDQYCAEEFPDIDLVRLVARFSFNPEVDLNPVSNEIQQLGMDIQEVLYERGMELFEDIENYTLLYLMQLFHTFFEIEIGIRKRFNPNVPCFRIARIYLIVNKALELAKFQLEPNHSREALMDTNAQFVKISSGNVTQGWRNRLVKACGLRVIKNYEKNRREEAKESR